MGSYSKQNNAYRMMGKEICKMTDMHKFQYGKCSCIQRRSIENEKKKGETKRIENNEICYEPMKSS